jgi:hypothetical protein
VLHGLKKLKQDRDMLHLAETQTRTQIQHPIGRQEDASHTGDDEPHTPNANNTASAEQNIAYPAVPVTLGHNAMNQSNQVDAAQPCSFFADLGQRCDPHENGTLVVQAPPHCDNPDSIVHTGVDGARFVPWQTFKKNHKQHQHQERTPAHI